MRPCGGPGIGRSLAVWLKEQWCLPPEQDADVVSPKDVFGVYTGRMIRSGP